MNEAIGSELRFGKLPQPADDEAGGQTGGRFFPALGILGIEHAMTQGGADTQHQFARQCGGVRLCLHLLS